MKPRVRFAPSPTGNVHIGNLRVAIFNWLFARHTGGDFLLRIEDTDRERSTPEAIQNLLDALTWLELASDAEPVYQSAQRQKHLAATDTLLAREFASRAGDDAPTILHLDAKLYDSSFVTEPRDEATIDLSKGEAKATARAILFVQTSSKGDVFTTPLNWDALAELSLEMADGSRQAGDALREKVTNAVGESSESVDLNQLLGGSVVKLHFKRRYVFYEDAVLGQLEKPLDSLRDLVIVRSDGSPVFHLANVVDDISMGITHILRGNDHVENTYRHLFLYRALGEKPPVYGHLPMIVNAKGKPYSKRDGDAYVGDFRAKGFLPTCLLNFLALCGWSPGDGREIMSREELLEAFSLERALTAPAQLNLEKLIWMNGQYLLRLPLSELTALIEIELAKEGLSAAEYAEDWLQKLVTLQQERMKTVGDFVANTRYFFAKEVVFAEKAVAKVLLKKEAAGLGVLRELLPQLEAVKEWTEEELARVIEAFTVSHELKMGLVAQPLRVAVTGGTVSPGIWETLFLIGRERVLARIKRALSEFA